MPLLQNFLTDFEDNTAIQNKGNAISQIGLNAP